MGAVASVPEAAADVPLDVVGEPGPLQLCSVAAVVLETEGEGAVEVVDEEIAAADALEGLAVADELRGEGEGVGRVIGEAALGGVVVEGRTEDACVEVGVAGYGKQVVEVGMGAEQRDESGRGPAGLGSCEVECEVVEDVWGQGEHGVGWGCILGWGSYGRTASEWRRTSMSSCLFGHALSVAPF